MVWVRTHLVVPTESIFEACDEIPLPELGLIEQTWATDLIPYEETTARAAETFGSLPLEDVPDGGEIALGVGSRGIANLGRIVAGIVTEAQDRGYEPFVFPAMGSRGGATAKGQREMLVDLGDDESTIGCEIRSSMELTEVSRTAERYTGCR